MQTPIVLAAIGVLVIIAYGDVRTRRIPNPLAASIAILGLTRMLIVGDPIGTLHTVEASCAVFGAGFLLFWRGVLGGGDAKLVTAMALIIRYDDLVAFLLLMSVCGGALAVAIIVRDNLPLLAWRLLRSTGTPVTNSILGPIVTPRRSTVPYGVAIAAAGVVTLVLETSSFQ